MKKILLVAAIAVMLCGCGKKNTYTITGNVTGLEGTVTLMNDQGEDIAEAPVTDGKFTIKGEVEEPAMALLSDDMQPLVIIFLEPGNIKVDGSMEEGYKVSGTKANESNTAYNDAQYAIMEKMFFAAGDEEREQMSADIDKLTEDTLNANLDNYFGLFLLTNFSGRWDGDKLIEKLDEFTPKMRETKLAGEIREQAEAKKLTEEGNKYIDVTIPDRDGNDLTLSSYIGEGKYVLLDFWASWCGPCLREIPHLKEAYEKYHAKGFEIFGISIDEDRESWIGAMDTHDMTWVNVCTSGEENQKTARSYGVTTIPTNFLIGPDGVIVAKNLRGEDLGKKLAGIFE